MGWAIMFLVLIALVIILSISLINWKIQIYKVIVQLNAILNRKTKKLVTVSLSDRRLEHLVEIINQIVSKDNIYLGEIQKKENEWYVWTRTLHCEKAITYDELYKSNN